MLATLASMTVLSAALACAGPVSARAVPAGRSVPEAGRKVIYLTFDDGPHETNTAQILRTLKKYDARATFFMVGRQASKHPQLVARVRAGGHAIGNHTHTHAWLPAIPATEVTSQIRLADAVIGRTRCLRPPGGMTSDAVSAQIRAEGKTPVLWTIDTWDWQRPDAAVIARRVLNSAAPRGIVLMHDGGGDRSRTVQALGMILPELKKAGYSFATLPACR